MLDALFNPASIVVIGASRDPHKVGHAVLRNLIQFHYKGAIYPVNPSSADVLGLKSFRNISEIGKAVDLAVIAIPAVSVADALVECASAGTKTAVILSAGFRETGKEGLLLEQRIRDISAEYGMRVLGPNCLGVISTSISMNATFAAGMLPRGKFAFFSQSGALGIAILDWAIGNRVGFSKFISLGNKTDLNEIDIIEYFVDDPDTDVILGYIEDVIDGKRFLEVAKKATKLKPIILLKAGGTEAGARAASSHTGALAGSETAFTAAFKQSGILKAEGVEDLFNTALVFSGGKLPHGDKLLLVTNAGGPGIIAADTAEKLGLRLAHMNRESIEYIEQHLPATASLYNPVDLIGDANADRYAVVLEMAIQDPEVDGIIVILTPQAMTQIEETAQTVVDISHKTEKPIIAAFMGEMSISAARENLKTNSIPQFSYPETAVNAYKRLYDYSAWRDRADEPAPKYSTDKPRVAALIDSLLHAGKSRIAEDEAKEILSQYGFLFPAKALAMSAREAAECAEDMGFPVVMKVSSPDILHKTEVGGVKLMIRSAREAEEAFTEITSNVKRLMPEAFINGVMVYKMIEQGKEVILGVNYDRTFGHMIMFGLGGIYVEVLKDISFRVVPVSRRDSLAMISEIRASALLRGARRERPSDIEAIVDGILRLSALVADFPVIHELDINPFMVMEKGAVALDARIVLESK